jgi:hypothetical protein
MPDQPSSEPAPDTEGGPLTRLNAQLTAERFTKYIRTDNSTNPNTPLPVENDPRWTVENDAEQLAS